MAKETVTIRVNPDTAQALADAANALGVTRSALLSDILDEIAHTDLVGIVQSIADRNYSRVVGFMGEQTEKAVERMQELELDQ